MRKNEILQDFANYKLQRYKREVYKLQLYTC